MSRRSGRGGRLRHADHRGGPRPHDPTRAARPASGALTGPGAVPPSTITSPGVPLAVPVDEQSASVAAPSPVGAEPTNVAASGQAVVDLAAPVDPLPAGPGGGSERPSNGPSVEPGPVAPTDGRRADDPTGSPERPGPDRAAGDRPAQERSAGCTTAQLRRFIKSRAYVPMHEIRRRFLIASEDDDVTPVAIGAGHIYVGLPLREGHMLGELLRGGEIGYELQLDPVTPVVVGVYPMRPVSRN